MFWGFIYIIAKYNLLRKGESIGPLNVNFWYSGMLKVVLGNKWRGEDGSATSESGD